MQNALWTIASCVAIVAFSLFLLSRRTLKAKNFDHFIATLKRHSCRTVSAFVKRSSKYVNSGIPRIANKMSFDLVAYTRTSRKIIYSECTCNIEMLVSGTDCDCGTLITDEIRLRAVVTMFYRLSSIHDRLPNIVCDITVDNNPLTRDGISEFFEDAQITGITPLAVPT